MATFVRLCSSPLERVLSHCLLRRSPSVNYSKLSTYSHHNQHTFVKSRTIHRKMSSDSTEVSLASLCSDIRQLSQGTRNVNLRYLDTLRQFVVLLDREPGFAAEVWRSGVVPILVELKDCGQSEVEAQARMALTLLGHAPPYNGRGLRILSIDGGGTRGLIPIAILKRLEELCCLPTHQMFDYVCGTSTGSIVAGLLCVKKSSIEDAEELYHDMSMEVFKMNNLLGISQLFLTHAFYDGKLLQKIVRTNEEAELLMYETTRDPDVPRLSIVSTIVNQPVIQPFLFCNYRHHPDNIEHAHYPSTCGVHGWKAIMASTAAPGYFEEVKIGPHVHQDGGLLSNNPCAIALHEARLLWGRATPIECIISLGTGLYTKNNKTGGRKDEPSTSLRDKLTKIVASATDTEAVHTILKDVLPPSAYFRFQPELSEDIVIDESNPEKLEQLVKDAERYLRENHDYIQQAADCLTAPKTSLQKAQDWSDTYWNKIRNKTLSVVQR